MTDDYTVLHGSVANFMYSCGSIHKNVMYYYSVPLGFQKGMVGKFFTKC
jgi:hypothetical protein